MASVFLSLAVGPPVPGEANFVASSKVILDSQSQIPVWGQ